MPAIDLSGQRFGKLIAVSPTDGRYFNEVIWLCRCDCGNEHRVRSSALRSLNTKSCGCLVAETREATFVTHGCSRVGKKRSEYNIWSAMKRRCLNTRERAYKWYGARGITVCQRWIDSFGDFLADMGDRPSKGHTLERRDNDKGYCPENCFWATWKEQGNNKRRCKFIEWQGETLTMQQWSDRLGIKYSLLQDRLKHGWTVEEAFTIPAKPPTPPGTSKGRDKVKCAAQQHVHRAVVRGDLPAVNTLACARCNQPATDYHHHKGYGRAHRLDVVPVCKRCHGKVRD